MTTAQSKGGLARAAALSPQERSRIATKAAFHRWSKQPIKRHYVSLEIKLAAALLQLGLDPKTAQLDHDPALELRAYKDVGHHRIYDPPEHDPRYLVWRSPEGHKAKTTGRRGESDLSLRDGDQGKIAKVRRITKRQMEFRRQLLAKARGEPPPKSRWPKGRKIRNRRKPT